MLQRRDGHDHAPAWGIRSKRLLRPPTLERRPLRPDAGASGREGPPTLERRPLRPDAGASGREGEERRPHRFLVPVLPRGDAILDALRPRWRSHSGGTAGTAEDPVPAREHGDEAIFSLRALRSHASRSTLPRSTLHSPTLHAPLSHAPRSTLPRFTLHSPTLHAPRSHAPTLHSPTLHSPTLHAPLSQVGRAGAICYNLGVAIPRHCG